MNRGAWQAVVHGIVELDTSEQQNTHTQLFLYRVKLLLLLLPSYYYLAFIMQMKVKGENKIAVGDRFE